MQAIVVSKYGGPDVLNVQEIPKPKPNENEVFIRLHAAGVNPVDTYIRDGMFENFTNLPYVPGMDGAGIVEELGPGVTRFKKGDRVFVYTVNQGTYAQFCVCPQYNCFPLPSKLTFSQGAAIGIPYFTAYRALFQVSKSKQPETVLVHGASGGVGLAAVQLAKQAGHRVFGTAGTEEGLKLVTQAGADHVFNHREKGYEKKILNHAKIDLILEMVADVNLAKDIEMLSEKGTIAIIGSRGSVSIGPGHLMGNQGSIVGVSVLKMDQHELTEAGNAIVKGLEEGSLVPTVHKEYSMAEAPQAHKDIMQAHGAKGKLVILL